jgi:hypothetical protein
MMPSRDRPYTLPKELGPKPKPPRVPATRSGKAEPWAYGPFRVVAQRRVSEEEQLSVECYATTRVEARTALREFLADFRSHMRAYNEQVVLVQQEHLQKIETMIEERGQEARRIEAEIAQLVAKKQDLTEAPDKEPPDADATS